MRVNSIFSKAGRVLGGVVLVAGAGMLSSCGEKKEETAVAPAAAEAAKPAASVPPVTAMKEPEAPVEKPAASPAASSTASAGAVVVKARFDGYQAQVARSLWQPVMLGEAAVQFALVSPLEAVPAGSGLVQEGGAENLALGLESGALRAVDGKPLVAGEVYEFRFSKGAGAAVWSVEVSAVAR